MPPHWLRKMVRDLVKAVVINLAAGVVQALHCVYLIGLVKAASDLPANPQIETMRPGLFDGMKRVSSLSSAFYYLLH